MKNAQKLSIILYTQEIQKTIDFYCNILNFTCSAKTESWTLLSFGKVQIMFSLPNEHLPFEKPTLTGSIYFYCDNVDALWDKYKDKAIVCYNVEDFDYGMREFAIYDNNNYLLQFGQELNV